MELEEKHESSKMHVSMFAQEVTSTRVDKNLFLVCVRLRLIMKPQLLLVMNLLSTSVSLPLGKLTPIRQRDQNTSCLILLSSHYIVKLNIYLLNMQSSAVWLALIDSVNAAG